MAYRAAQAKTPRPERRGPRASTYVDRITALEVEMEDLRIDNHQYASLVSKLQREGNDMITKLHSLLLQEQRTTATLREEIATLRHQLDVVRLKAELEKERAEKAALAAQLQASYSPAAAAAAEERLQAMQKHRPRVDRRQVEPALTALSPGSSAVDTEGVSVGASPCRTDDEERAVGGNLLGASPNAESDQGGGGTRARPVHASTVVGRPAANAPGNSDKPDHARRHLEFDGPSSPKS